MVKARTSLLSIKQCLAPFSTSVVSMGIVVINCIRCTNYFFRIVALMHHDHEIALTLLPT